MAEKIPETWKEYGERFTDAWDDLIIEIAKALYVDKLLNWLTNKLSKGGE